MENYTNYKTGKPCSRAEYIQNGLDRGELLYKYDCGCVIIQDRTADAYIVYCPKHEAAPELYEALKDILPELKEYVDEVGGCDHLVGICVCGLTTKLDNIEQAITKAGGNP